MKPITFALLAGSLFFSSQPYAEKTTLLSRSVTGFSGENASFPNDISADGSAVVFISSSSNLVNDDTNSFIDLFYVDTVTGNVQRINVDPLGNQAEYDDPEFFGTETAENARLNADGDLVVFESNATNLVPDDTNESSDIFLWDKSQGFSTRMNITSNGLQSQGFAFEPDISGDSAYVVFTSFADDLVSEDTSAGSQIYLRDRIQATTTLVSRNSDGVAGDSDSENPVISADGRFVAYLSSASNLTDTDTVNTNGVDVFVYDIENQITTKVNVSSTGEEANGTSQFFDPPAISGDGGLVVFQSDATNLVSSDTNAQADVFVRDVANNETRRVNVSSSGEQSINVFASPSDPDISNNGRFVTFSSFSENLVEGDNNLTDDVFLHDLETGSTTIVNVRNDGTATGNRSFLGRINGDGGFIAYASRDSGIADMDDNFSADVFLLEKNALCDPTEARHQFNLPDNQFALLSLPCAVPPGTTVSDLFEDDIGAPYSDLDWVVFTFVPSMGNSGAYKNIGASGELVAGQGFWIIQATGQAVTLTLPEGSRKVSISDADDPACQSSLGCVRSSLSELDIPVDQATGQSLDTRWNMLGNPLNEEAGIPADQIRITTAAGQCMAINGGCTLEQAVLPSIDVSPNVLFRFNITTGAYQPIFEMDNITIWDGLWVGELNQAVDNAGKIVFPLIESIPVVMSVGNDK